MSEVPESVAYARQLAHEIEQQYPGIDVYLTGVTLANNAFIEASRNDMKTLIPLMFLAMLAIMVICLRSVSGMFATVMVVILATATAMGMAGWFRTGLTAPSAQAPTIIMTLAIADCIHILVTLLRQMAKGSSKTEAIVQSMQVNIQPVFLTSVTTAIGFLCLNFSDVPPFHHLGNITAFGVILAGAFAMFFLPAFIAILPIKVRKQRDRGNPIIDRIANLVINNQRKILATTAIVTVLLGIFIARNELNDGFVVTSMKATPSAEILILRRNISPGFIKSTIHSGQEKAAASMSPGTWSDLMSLPTGFVSSQMSGTSRFTRIF